MNIFYLIFIFILCTACDEYTITNRTNRDIQLIVSGGDFVMVPAGECIKLTEVLMGLGGEFPFKLKDCPNCGDKEYTSDHYEIEARKRQYGSNKKEVFMEYISSSDENLSCIKEDKTKSAEEDTEQVQSPAPKLLRPMCTVENAQAICQNETGQSAGGIKIKCIDGESSSRAECVNDEDEILRGFTAVCQLQGQVGLPPPVCQ